MVDAASDVAVRAFEGGVGIEWHRIRNRPVQPRKGVAEFFVDVVADRDDEVVVVQDLVEGHGAAAVNTETVAVGDGDGPRVDTRAGMGAR